MITASQSCVGSRCSMTWVSHMYVYTYIPSLLRLPLFTHLIPLGLHRTPSWAPSSVQELPTTYLFYTRWFVYMSRLLSQLSSPIPSRPVFHKSILDICISISALQIGSSVPFSQIYGICFSLSDFKQWEIIGSSSTSLQIAQFVPF